MNRTTNLELKKPEYSDAADIEDINDNMDVLDGVIGAVPSGSNVQGQINTLQTSVGGKADKVSSPTNGNFAGLDSNGNLVDSGHKHSDYVITASLISGNKYRINL